MSLPLVKLFKEQLENESKAIADQLGLLKRGDFLIWWYFQKLIGLEASETEEIICDGAADLGIDAIWIDEDELVHFYTFKNPENLSSVIAAGDNRC